MPPPPRDPLIADDRRLSVPAKARTGLLFIAFALLGVTIYVLYSNHLKQDQDQPDEIMVPIEQAFMQVPPAIDLSPPPDIKIPALYFEANVNTATAPRPAPLPPYEKANDFFTEQFALVQWQGLNITPQNLPALNKDFMLQRSVAFLDGLSKGLLQNKLLPFARPRQAFIADKRGQTLSMGPANYQRYDAFTQSIIAIDSQQAAAFFHWTRPLLETAYGELGYPGEDLGGALLSAIDTLLATPDIEGSIVLKRESVRYQYADPTIEALPGAQKQLLRVGSKNSTLLKSWLRELRSALLAPGQKL